MPFYPCYTPILDMQARKYFRQQALFADWPAPPNVRAVATTRDGSLWTESSPYGFNLGTRCGDDPATVADNRVFLREALALPAEPRWLHQVHGKNVVALDCPRPGPPPHAGEGGERAAQTDCTPLPLVGKGAGRAFPGPDPGVDGGIGAQEPDADAAVTRTPGVVLAILTADCLPVLFCAEDGSEIAAAHAGWRGLSAGVLENTLRAMHSRHEKVLAWLGPAIAAQSYEVGDEVRDAFLAHDSAASVAFTATRPGHWLCDLYELARQRLHAAGVTHVFGGDLDTFTDPRLHSYRRDGAKSGRMASLIWVAP